MKLIKSTRFWYLSGLLFLDLLFFGRTDPAKTPSILLVVGFMLTVVTLYWIARLIIATALIYKPGLISQESRLAKHFTGVIAALLAMQTLGQLTFRDLLAFLPFVLIFYGYVTYLNQKSVKAGK